MILPVGTNNSNLDYFRGFKTEALLERQEEAKSIWFELLCSSKSDTVTLAFWERIQQDLEIVIEERNELR